ncbi:MAG: hypothetical protein V4675_22435, partial [Verrucomicrobiota bacterium]
MSAEDWQGRGTFTTGSVEQAVLTTQDGWHESEIIVLPGYTDLRWLVTDPGTYDQASLWIDQVSFTPMANVSAAAALEATGLAVTASNWKGLATGAASDGVDALFASVTSYAEADQLTLTASGSGWLKYRSRGALVAPSLSTDESAPSTSLVETITDGSAVTAGVWQQRKVFIPPGSLHRITWQQVIGFALDQMAFEPLTTLSLAEAADFPGSWSGTAQAISDPYYPADGTDCLILTGPAIVEITGPGLLRWSDFVGSSVQLDNGPGLFYNGTGTSWKAGGLVIGPGVHSVAWSHYSFNNLKSRLDKVSFTPSLPMADALDNETMAFSAMGPVTGMPTLAGEGADGADAVQIGFGGEVSCSPVGSGLLRFWAEAGLELEMNGAIYSTATGWHEVDIAGPSATLRWRVPATSHVTSRFLLDSISFNPDPAARWGNRLGTEADAFWYVRSSAPLEISEDPVSPGRKVLKPAFPWPDAGQSSLTAIPTIPNAGQMFLQLRESRPLYSSITVSSRNGSTNPMIFTNSSVQEGADRWFYLPPPAAPRVVFDWNRAGDTAPWMVSGLSLTRARDESLTVADALDSTLPWTSPAAGWSPLAGLPGPGPDALFSTGLISPAPLVSAVASGPAFLTFYRSGSLILRQDGVLANALTSVDAAASGFRCVFVDAGSHNLGFSPAANNSPVILDEVKLTSPDFQPLAGFTSPGITIALPPAENCPGCPLPYPVGSSLAWQGAEALSIDRSGLVARAEAPGFLTWRANSPSGTSSFTAQQGGSVISRALSAGWTMDTMAAGVGPSYFRFASAGTGTLDTVEFIPRTETTLDLAADSNGPVLTAVPGGSWRGFVGAPISQDGIDAVALATPAADASPASLNTTLPGAGSLTWWWRSAQGSALACTGAQPSSADTNGNWRFAVLRVAAAANVSWRASGREGGAWIDGLTWQAGAVPDRAEAVDAPGLIFTASAPSAWTGESASFGGGGDVLCSGNDAVGTWVETGVLGPARIHFSSFVNTNALGYLSVTAVGLSYRTGLESRDQWGRHFVTVGPGHHKIRWEQQSLGSRGRAFLDAISVEPLADESVGQLQEALELSVESQPAAQGFVHQLPSGAGYQGGDGLQIGTGSVTGSLTLPVARGTSLSFRWAAPESALSASAGIFQVDGVPVAAIRSDTGWREFNLDIPAGNGAALVEWTSLPGRFCQLDQVTVTSLGPPTATPAEAAVAAGSGIQWLGNPDLGGAGWTVTSANSLDGLAATSEQAAIVELDVPGPGYLLFDYAAANISISVNGVLQASRPARPGAALEVSDWQPLARGFRLGFAQLSGGLNRVRLAAAGRLFLDRVRTAGTVTETPLDWDMVGNVSTSRSGDSVLYATKNEPATAEVLTRLAGPGSLSLTWGTMATHRMLLDGQIIQEFASKGSAYALWNFQIDIPPGVHEFSIAMGINPNAVVGLTLPSARFVPGLQPLAAGSGTTGFRSHTIGVLWTAGNGAFRAPNATAASSELSLNTQGPALVGFVPEVNISQGVLLRELGLKSHASLSSGNRLYRLLDREMPWTLVLAPGLLRATDVTRNPLTIIPLADAMEAAPGWQVSAPPDGKWIGLGDLGPFAGFFTGGTAAMSTILPGENSSRLSLQPPVGGSAAAIRFGARTGQPAMAGGLIRLGETVVSTISSVDATSGCYVELPANSPALSFEATPGFSLAVDGMEASVSPAIGAVLQAPGLPWIAHLWNATHPEIYYPSVAVPTGIKIGRVSATGYCEDLATVVHGPATLEIKLTGSGTRISINGITTIIPATASRVISLPLHPSGPNAISISVSDSGGFTTLEQVTVRPVSLPGVDASLPRALD